MAEETIIDYISQKVMLNNTNSINNSENKKTTVESKTCFQVVEYLYQNVLPLQGEGMDKYDVRIIKKRISTKARADALVEELRAKAECNKLSHHFRYEVENYIVSRSNNKRSKHF